jgi:cell wall-associated NlpC family hydrolase
LLFSFGSEPVPGGPRPAGAHVAISLGDGRTIEARGRKWGVGTWEAGNRFEYAAVIPGLEPGR